MSLNLQYTRIDPPSKVCCFDITFSHEHGDADMRDSYSCTYSFERDKLAAFLNKVDQLQQVIDISHSCGTKVPDSFEDDAIFEGEYIPVELDCYAKMHMSGYYASLSVEKIVYYDENGIAFNVTF